MSYQDFTRTGKIGCSDCYKTFALALEPLLRRFMVLVPISVKFLIALVAH